MDQELPKEIQFLVNRIIMSMLNVAIKATLCCISRASASMIGELSG